ncbi:MAG: hypothetical protein AAGI11_22625 [Pseudomonadota bacterium]
MNDITHSQVPSPGLRINPVQALKVVVYSLLLVNFVLYIRNDIQIAAHTYHAGWTLVDWSSAYATTLGLTAWFMLLLLFELETYILPEAWFTKLRLRMIHGIRLLCYVFIANTLFAFTDYAIKLHAAEPVEGTTLCTFADQDLSFTSNIEYTELNPENCETLSDANRFYIFEEGTLITDGAGMRIERELAWSWVVEAAVWLLILALIETAVRMQDRGITRGRALRLITATRWCLFGVLWITALFWISYGHWLFAWDASLWILGFTAIGMNLSAWRDEIEEQAGPTPA